MVLIYLFLLLIIFEHIFTTKLKITKEKER